MIQTYALVSAADLDALRDALARAFTLLEILEQGLLDEPIATASSEASLEAWELDACF